MSNFSRRGSEDPDAPELRRERGGPIGPRGDTDGGNGGARRNRKRTIILVTITAAAILVAGGVTAAIVFTTGGDSESKYLERTRELLEDMGSETSKDGESVPERRELPATIHDVGEIVDLDGLELEVRGWSFSFGEGLQEADPGKRYLLVDLYLVNKSDKAVKVSGMLQMSVLSRDGTVYGTSFYFPEPRFPDGEIEPGESAGGKVSFEVPGDEDGFCFVFESDPIRGGKEAGIRLE